MPSLHASPFFSSRIFGIFYDLIWRRKLRLSQSVKCHIKGRKLSEPGPVIFVGVIDPFFDQRWYVPPTVLGFAGFIWSIFPSPFHLLPNVVCYQGQPYVKSVVRSVWTVSINKRFVAIELRQSSWVFKAIPAHLPIRFRFPLQVRFRSGTAPFWECHFLSLPNLSIRQVKCTSACKLDRSIVRSSLCPSPMFPSVFRLPGSLRFRVVSGSGQLRSSASELRKFHCRCTEFGIFKFTKLWYVIV